MKTRKEWNMKLGMTVAAALVCLGAQGSQVAASSFSEPYTVFYGKVIGTGSVQPFLISEGTLNWTIERSDGSLVTLQTSLYAYHDDQFSYRLNVPHSVLALGAEEDPSGVPMPPFPRTHLHSSITVDGEAAVLLGPAGTAFTTEQILRAATYRLDLAVGRTAVDTDGDGIADWWEDLHGLDKQDPSDANSDLSGDGITALQAYLRGLDPRLDARAPALLTTELVVYPSGSTAVLLDTADVDSANDTIVYTITALPAAGVLTLRNAVEDPANPDLVLSVGSTFSQADLLTGRVTYDHDGSVDDPGFFSVEVRDENPGHPADSGDVRLLAFEPAFEQPDNLSLSELQRIDNYFRAGEGFVVMDASAMPSDTAIAGPSAGLTADALDEYLAIYGQDRSYAFVSGKGTNIAVSGGHCDDVIAVNEGRGSLAGGAGADVFGFNVFEGGRVTINDYNPSEGDVIDVTRMPVIAQAFAHNYLRLVQAGGVYELQTALSGDGASFTNLSIALPGLAEADTDLYKLVQNGNLLIGSLRLEPRITVVAGMAQASENGPTPGQFTFMRDGSLADDLLVGIQVSGDAVNGADYVFVSDTVNMPAGVPAVDVQIMPYADSVAESAETVHLLVKSGAGYRVGAANQATVTIEDLLMLVKIEALEPIAVKESGSAGTFLISRSGIIDRDVTVHLTIGGTAVNGTHYEAIQRFAYLDINKTAAFISISPKSGTQLAGGIGTVELTIGPSSDYRIVGDGRAQVAIVERMDSFAGWRSREVPGVEGDMAVFGSTATGQSGLTYLERYAFGVGLQDADLSGLPQPFVLNGRLGVTFRKPLSLTDVEYRVRSATNLMDWNGSSVAATVIPAPDGAANPERVYYLTDEDADSAFILIEVEWKP